MADFFTDAVMRVRQQNEQKNQPVYLRLAQQTQTASQPQNESRPATQATQSLIRAPGQTVAQTAFNAPTQVSTPLLDNAVGNTGTNAAAGGTTALARVFNSAEGRTSDLGDYGDILTRADYGELSKPGESKFKGLFDLGGDSRYDYINDMGDTRARWDARQARGEGGVYGVYSFMTDEERGIYNYLYATEGKKAANAFLDYLEPQLNRQMYSGQEAVATEEATKNGLNKALYSIGGALAAPTRGVTAAAALAQDVGRTVTGRGIDPYSPLLTPSRIVNAERAEISGEMEEKYGTAGRMIYNAAMSGLDNLVNMAFGSVIGGGAGLSGAALNNLVSNTSSLLMSSEGAALAIAEAKEKGYSDLGALSLGIARGAISYAVEKVGMDWMFDGMKVGPRNLLKNLLRASGAEAAEEVTENWADRTLDLIVDGLFGTQESSLNNMARYYAAGNGTAWQQKNPEMAALLSAFLEDLESAGTAALSAAGSATGGYITNTVSINNTARELNATPEAVYDVMAKYDIQNGQAIQAIVEAAQVENMQELDEFLGTERLIRELNDRAMQEQGQQEQSQTQPAQQEQTAPAQTETAATQTAPVSEAQAAVTEILQGTVSNSKAESIITDPELRAAFEEMTGIKLEGTKSEQRAAIKEYAARMNATEQAPQTQQTEAQAVSEAQTETLTNDERNELLEKLESLTRLADQYRIRADKENEALIREQIKEVQRQLRGDTAPVSEAQAAVTEILQGTVSNSKAESIITDPELRAAFEEMTGIKLEGTKSEQRAAIKEYAANQQNTQQNIDNAENAAYTNPVEGRNTDGRLDQETGGTLRQESDSPINRGGTAEGQSSGQGNLGVPSGNGVLSPEARQVADTRGIVNAGLHDSTGDNASFSAALATAKANDPAHGCSVDNHTAEELDESGAKTFLSDNGMAGVAVEPNGNITAVFNDPKNPVRGVSSDLMLTAIENGGNKLDCFVVDGPKNLSRIYSRFGFEPVAWMKFDHETWQKYHPGETWNFETMGEPIVVFFVHNGDSVTDVINNSGNYQYYSSADIQSNFPEITDYDDGPKYQESRLSEIAEQRQQNSDSGNDGMPPMPPANPIQTVQPNAQPGTEGTRLSQTVQTTRDSGVTTDEFRAIIDKDIQKGEYRYIPITNDQTVEQAMQTITAMGWEAARGKWQSDVNHGVAGDQMSALGALLYNHALETDNFELATEILGDMAVMGRNTARGLQAMKILQTLAPATRMTVIEKQLAKLNEKYGNRVNGKITISEETKNEYKAAQNDKERDAAYTKMIKEVAAQIPANWRDKFTALRYLNMLGNLRTQGRNILGNTFMQFMYGAKNANQTLLESIAKAVNPDYQRQTTLFANRDLVNEAKADYDENAEWVNGDQKYNESQEKGFAGDVEEQRQIFSSKILEMYRKATNWAMTKGDTLFIKARYARALAGYLQANGMNAETFAGIRNGTIKATTEQTALLNQAREYAAQEAQESTFHDTNQISEWVSKFGRGEKTPGWAKAIAEGVMPFRKTPANVAVRAWEFSPAGLVSNAVTTAYDAAKGNFDSAKFLGQLSKNLTGTGLFALGMWLRRAGWLHGHEDDEKQAAFNEMQGLQDYSLVLPDGSSYTLDWAAPSSIPLFMGVNLADLMADGGISWGEMLGQVWSAMTDPMLEMSMLQGLNDLIDNIRYAEGSGIANVALNALMGLATQYSTNTLLGQLERAFQGERTTTYTDADTRYGKTLQRSLGSALNKTPGLDYGQVEYVDAWGRTQQNSGLIGQLLSPGYYAGNNSTDVDGELQSLYDRGMTNVFPTRAPQSTTLSVYDEHGIKTGERHMTGDEYVRYLKLRGQTSLEMVRELINSDVYNAMTDEAKADAISAIYSYAAHQAAMDIEPSTKDDDAAISKLSNIPAYYAVRAAVSNATSNEFNRDTDSMDRVLSEFSALPEDVQTYMLKHVNGLRHVYEASEAGIDSAEFYRVYDAVGALTPAPGYTNVAGWQQVSAAAEANIPDEDKDFFMTTMYFKDGSVDKYNACREAGYTPYDISEFYRIYQTTKGDDKNGDGRSDNGTKENNVIAAAVERGFSQKAAQQLFKIWNKK